MSNCLQVVPPRLLNALMGVDGGVSGRAREVFTVPVWNMLPVTVLVALGEAEVDDVDGIPVLLTCPNEEVIRLDIPVDDSLIMNLLQSFYLHTKVRSIWRKYHLDSNHQHCFHVEAPLALLEDVL